jgi:hypothetical protein
VRELEEEVLQAKLRYYHDSRKEAIVQEIKDEAVPSGQLGALRAAIDGS